MEALGLVVLEKKIFFVLPMTPPGRVPPPPLGGRMVPRGTVGRIYKGDHNTLLHTKSESSGPCGLGEEDFFMFFPL